METLLLEIGETAHALRRAFSRRAAALGVTGAQWKVLFWLRRTSGLRQVQLAEMLEVEPITLSRIIDRLAEARLVERAPDPADRRAWRLHLTPNAQPLIEQLRDIAEELALEAFEGLSRRDLDALRGTLAKIGENIRSANTVVRRANQ